MKATGNFAATQNVDPMVALTDATRAHIDHWTSKFPADRRRSPPCATSSSRSAATVCSTKFPIVHVPEQPQISYRKFWNNCSPRGVCVTSG